jgi:hypothetical protein
MSIRLLDEPAKPATGVKQNQRITVSNRLLKRPFIG